MKNKIFSVDESTMEYEEKELIKTLISDNWTVPSISVIITGSDSKGRKTKVKL